MFSHVFIGVGDFDRALAFYQPLLASLGMEARFCDRTRPWAGWQQPGRARPLFLIGAPYEGLPPRRGKGQLPALLAPDRGAFVADYAFALAHGGRDDGAPGLRPHYHEHYYGAYVRDPDGNKLCVVCHDPESTA